MKVIINNLRPIMLIRDPSLIFGSQKFLDSLCKISNLVHKIITNINPLLPREYYYNIGI